MWLWWILASSVVLSLYDIGKKASVRGNAVFPVLFGTTLSGWLAVSAFLLARGELAAAAALPARQAGLLLIKSCIVGASWTATYMALRTLPITLAAPIRATGPMWTLLGAVFIFSERPTALQNVGIFLTLAGCIAFSLLGRRDESSAPLMRRAIALAFAGTLFGSCSALYDKCLLQSMGMPPGTVLWWFMGGMCVIYAAITAVVGRGGFEWRITMPCVGVLLAISDACYFNAVAVPDAKISVLSLIRRSSVVLTFLLGGAMFHETDLRRRAIALAAIVAGVALLCLA